MIDIRVSIETRQTFSSLGVCECWAWCFENFGYPNLGRWTWDTYRKFSFKHEADAIMFALRWA